MGFELGFPESRGEFLDLGSRVLGDPLEHIDQVGVGVDLVEAAGDDEALDDADPLGSVLSTNTF